MSHITSLDPSLADVSLYRSAPFKISDIGQNHVRVQKGADEERLIKIDAVLEGPCIFIRLDAEDGAWPFLLRNDSDYPVTFNQAVRDLLLQPRTTVADLT